MLLLIVLVSVGVIAGALATRLPMSGRAALVIAVAPIAGLWCAHTWC